MSEPIQFRGIVAYERFYNEESFWGVYNVRVKENLPYAEEVTKADPFENEKDFEPYYIVCVAGKMQQLYVGSEYNFTATCEYNSKYKAWNYVPSAVTAIAPKSIEESRLFLSTILTQNQVNVLLAEYPDIVQQIMNGEDNVDLNRLKGIKDKTYAVIKDKIINNYVISDIITILQPVGVTYTAVKSLLRWEPNPAILRQKILANPYCITVAKGFGFKRVDKMALKMDPSLLCSGKRLVAYMKYYLTKAADNEGHTWVDFSQLRSGVVNDIPQCIGLFDKLVSLENNGQLGGIFYTKDGKIGLNIFHDYEKYTYEILKELELYPFNGKIDVETGIKKAEAELGYELSEEQREVVRQIEKSNVVVFTGPAGTGKSSTARAILNSFPASSIACCSLSAKAAQRIQEATGFQAMTIHRLLKYNGSGFEHNAKDRLDEDVVFLDEASMVNCSLFYDLVSAIKEGAKLIICGDYAQLPPIGAGNTFSDILQMDKEFNVTILQKVHRQAEESGVLTDANKIREGIYPIENPTKSQQRLILTGNLQDMAYVFRDDKNRIQDIVVNQFMKAKEAHGLDSVVVAVPRRDEVVNSALEINKQIQRKVIDTKNTYYIQSSENKFYIGDRIIQTENDAKRDIYNGEVGFVEKVFATAKNEEVCMVARFKSTMNGTDKIITYNREQLQSVLLGYCLSVHRLQGSEYDYVIVVLDDTHYALLDRCLLYTGITRAKRMCILVSQPEAFNKAMKTNKTVNRQTWLRLKYENASA